MDLLSRSRRNSIVIDDDTVPPRPRQQVHTIAAIDDDTTNPRRTLNPTSNTNYPPPQLLSSFSPCTVSAWIWFELNLFIKFDHELTRGPDLLSNQHPFLHHFFPITHLSLFDCGGAIILDR
mmetsp:Transcript_36972/g.78876  ORF Transcript_36972/g.78876 Transcript_36972/m.78876 type:complete len:121 (+) Transcript_36972:578-940(+)